MDGDFVGFGVIAACAQVVGEGGVRLASRGGDSAPPRALRMGAASW